MADIKTYIGKYIGKMLEVEGTDYKKYKLTFQVDDKQLNFKAFTPWTKKDGSEKSGLKPNQLEESQWYKIGFTEFKSVHDNKEYISKTIVTLYNSTEPTEKQLDNSNGKTQVLSNEFIDEIISSYIENVDDKLKSVNHFIGTVIRTLNPEQVKEYIDIYNTKIKNR